MENSFQTSFIPKKQITTNGNLKNPPKSLSMIFSVFLLVIVGLASGGLFVYKNYLIKHKADLNSSVVAVEKSFDKDTVDKLSLYDKRASASRQILDSHIMLSPLFILLGSLTIPEIQYTKFNHETTPQGFFVKMSGVASSYRSIALQADAFSRTEGHYFKNVVFSNLTKSKDNSRVLFDVEFIVDPELLSYQKNILSENANTKAKTEIPSTVVPSVNGSNTIVPTTPPDTKNNSQPLQPDTNIKTQ